MSFAGRLRHRVQIQEASETRDAYGGVTTTWTTVGTVYAAIVPMHQVGQGRERLEADRIQSEVTHRITTRFRGDVTPKHRILFEGRVFELERVANVDERDRELSILAIERG